MNLFCCCLSETFSVDMSNILTFCLRRSLPKYLKRDKVSGASTAMEAIDEAVIKPVKRVRINPDASVVMLDSIPDPGVGERSASASALSPKAAGRVAIAEPSPKIDEVVDPTDKEDGTEREANLLLRKFTPLELYE